MEEQANELIEATQAAINQASELAVEYAFSVLGAIVLLVLGWALARFVSRWAYEGISHLKGVDETLARFFANMLRYVLLVLVVVTVLGQFGVQTASIIAALGAAGLAVGLALQGTLQNIAAGIMLLVLRPFRVGEYIDNGTVSGTVLEVGLFATELKTGDGLYRMAPNSTLWNTPITNYSRRSTRQNEVSIGIGYSDDIDLALRTLIELAQADPRVQSEPKPEAFVNTIGPSSVSVTLRYWAKNEDWWSTSRDMVRLVKQRLEEKGISIPYPQVIYNPTAARGGPG